MKQTNRVLFYRRLNRCRLFCMLRRRLTEGKQKMKLSVKTKKESSKIFESVPLTWIHKCPTSGRPQTVRLLFNIFE